MTRLANFLKNQHLEFWFVSRFEHQQLAPVGEMHYCTTTILRGKGCIHSMWGFWWFGWCKEELPSSVSLLNYSLLLCTPIFVALFQNNVEMVCLKLQTVSIFFTPTVVPPLILFLICFWTLSTRLTKIHLETSLLSLNKCKNIFEHIS